MNAILSGVRLVKSFLGTIEDAIADSKGSSRSMQDASGMGRGGNPPGEDTGPNLS